MLFEDETGKVLMSEEVDELDTWELDFRKFHVYEDIWY